MERFAEENLQYHNCIVTENSGNNQASGWNQAIRSSTGDIIIRLDAHGRIPEDFVSKNVECMKSGEYVTGGPRPNLPEKTHHGRDFYRVQKVPCSEVESQVSGERMKEICKSLCSMRHIGGKYLQKLDFSMKIWEERKIMRCITGSGRQDTAYVTIRRFIPGSM